MTSDKNNDATQHKFFVDGIRKVAGEDVATQLEKIPGSYLEDDISRFLVVCAMRRQLYKNVRKWLKLAKLAGDETVQRRLLKLKTAVLIGQAMERHGLRGRPSARLYVVDPCPECRMPTRVIEQSSDKIVAKCDYCGRSHTA